MSSNARSLTVRGMRLSELLARLPSVQAGDWIALRLRHGPGTGGAGPDQVSPRRRWLVLAICCLSVFIVGLDSTIVNVALPSIQRGLHAPVSGLQWTVDAYTLVLANFLILSGSAGDRVGRRRIFETGLVLFIVGSLLCGVAPGLPPEGRPSAHEHLSTR